MRHQQTIRMLTDDKRAAGVGVSTKPRPLFRLFKLHKGNSRLNPGSPINSRSVSVQPGPADRSTLVFGARRPVHTVPLLAGVSLVCLLTFVSGCGSAEDRALLALRERGIEFTLDDGGAVSGLYFYSNRERTFGDDDLSIVKQFPGLKLLLVESRHVSDAGLEHLKSLGNLEQLDLAFCLGETGESGETTGGITDAGLAVLETMSGLKRIGLQATRATDAAVDRLQRARPDCKIDFNYNDPIVGDMRRQGKDIVYAFQQIGRRLPQLGITIELDDDENVTHIQSPATDLALRYIGQIETLKSLTLHGNFTGAGLKHLTGLTKLESLNIVDPYGRRTIDSETMKTLTSFSRLKSLDVSGCQVAAADLPMLSDLAELETLKLIGCPLTDSALKQLKQSMPDCEITHSNDPLLNALLNHADDLNAAVEQSARRVERDDDGKIVGAEFRLSRISDRGLSELKKLEGLRWLHFVYCRRFTDVGLRHVGKMSMLTDLTLSHTSVSSRGIAEIAALQGLEKLDLTTNRVGAGTGPRIDDGGMRDVAALKELTILSLRGTDVTDRGLRNLDKLTKLTSLDVRRTQVTEEGVRRLQQKLPSCKIEF